MFETCQDPQSRYGLEPGCHDGNSSALATLNQNSLSQAKAFRLQSTCSVARPKVRVRPPLTAGATPGAQHQELPAHWLAKKWQEPSFELSTATKGYSHRCGHRHL